MIEILQTIHNKYIPQTGNEILEESIFGGDLLTCERCMNAQEDMRDAPSSAKRLTGLKPVIEDFHTFGNFLQVSTSVLPAQTMTYSILYKM